MERLNGKRAEEVLGKFAPDVFPRLTLRLEPWLSSHTVARLAVRQRRDLLRKLTQTARIVVTCW